MTTASMTATAGAAAPPSGDDALRQRVLAKLRPRIVLYCFVLFIINYLDRVNVGFAALHMNKDLGLSATAYGLGAGIFFLGYIAFEVPSNMIMHRVGPRRWIARIMVSWGSSPAAWPSCRGSGASTPCASCLASPKPASCPGSCST